VLDFPPGSHATRSFLVFSGSFITLLAPNRNSLKTTLLALLGPPQDFSRAATRTVFLSPSTFLRKNAPLFFYAR